jgi:anti-anti-sigma factor
MDSAGELTDIVA